MSEFLIALMNVISWLSVMGLSILILLWSIFGGTWQIGTFLTITLNGLIK